MLKCVAVRGTVEYNNFKMENFENPEHLSIVMIRSSVTLEEIFVLFCIANLAGNIASFAN